MTLYNIIDHFIVFVQVKFLGHDFSSLFAEITPDQLPEEFGGNMPPFSGEYSLKFLEGRTEETNK